MVFISAEESASSAEMDAFLIVKKERKRMKKEGLVRIPSGCAISAVISRKGERMSGEGIMKSMVPMHERSNGLGGGFAAYGIYPEYRDFYAFHVFFEDDTSRRMNLSQCDMASAAGISNSIKQLSGSVSIALLTVILTGRTAFHSAQGGLSSAESYVAGISDDFLFVTFVSLASALPFLWLLRPRRKAASFKSEGTGT